MFLFKVIGADIVYFWTYQKPQPCGYVHVQEKFLSIQKLEIKDNVQLTSLHSISPRNNDKLMFKSSSFKFNHTYIPEVRDSLLLIASISFLSLYLSTSSPRQIAVGVLVHEIQSYEY